MGTFVGQCCNDFAVSFRKLEPKAFTATGLAASITANRISNVFGLAGPLMVTACSSSLVAVNTACKSIHTGDCELAVVVGVGLNLTMDNFTLFSAGNLLSRKGKYATFSDNADGYCRGEGCGAIMLKPLSKAIADRNEIWGVLHGVTHGSAVNQDWRTASLTAPNGPAQERVIRMAIKRAGITPEDVGYVEAHGTGTALGDPQEVGALANVFGKRKRTLVLGAVKSNLGHLEGAAGMSGIIKAVLCLQHQRVPPNIHCEQLNPELEQLLVKCMLEFHRKSVNLKGGLFAGVSAFGFGGTNAHVVLWAPPY